MEKQRFSVLLKIVKGWGVAYNLEFRSHRTVSQI